MSDVQLNIFHLLCSDIENRGRSVGHVSNSQSWNLCAEYMRRGGPYQSISKSEYHHHGHNARFNLVRGVADSTEATHGHQSGHLDGGAQKHLESIVESVPSLLIAD